MDKPYEVVSATNRPKVSKNLLQKNIFEPQENGVDKIKSEAFVASRPIWLQLVDVFSNREIEFGFSLNSVEIVAECLLQPYI